VPLAVVPKDSSTPPDSVGTPFTETIFASLVLVLASP
jgi:hypothetical protein